MTKSELIQRIADNKGITQAQAKSNLDLVLEAIADGVRTTGKVNLLGFGNFSTTERKARTGRNPQTGESLQIPAKTVIKFKAQF